MKRSGRRRLTFDDDPKIVPLDEQDTSDDAVKLYVYNVEHDPRVGRRAEVACWNGKLLDRKLVALDRQLDCRRFARSVAEQDSSIDTQKVLRALAQANDVLATLLREAAANGAADSEGAAAPAGMTEEEATALWERVKDLAETADLLSVIDTVLGRLVVGEEKNRRLLYLGLTARLLLEPVCIFVKGVSSGGKSHLVLQVARLFPTDAILNYTSTSDHYLIYTDDDLRHRVVLLLEAKGLGEGFAAYIMRTLISENCIKYGTVVSGDEGRPVPVKIEKEGPTGFVSTTTQGMEDFELENRVLTLTIDDTTQQTKGVLERQGQQAAQTLAPLPDLERFIDLQRWLASQDVHDVRVPFAPALAPLMPASVVRVRRDFPQVLSLIKACALLHQAQRAKTPDGLPIAQLEDYQIVYDLLAAPFSAAQADGVTDKQREVVEAIAKLAPSHPEGVSLRTLAEYLDVSPSAVNQRLRNLLAHGYVQNPNADKKGIAASFKVGDPLPLRKDNLPKPEAVREAMEQQGSQEEEEWLPI